MRRAAWHAAAPEIAARASRQEDVMQSWKWSLVPLFAMAVGACGSTSTTTEPSACTADFQALVAASDYSSSGVGALSTNGTEMLRVAVDLGGDPALASSGGRAFFVARDQDAVVELDTR